MKREAARSRRRTGQVTDPHGRHLCRELRAALAARAVAVASTGSRAARAGRGEHRLALWAGELSEADDVRRAERATT